MEMGSSETDLQGIIHSLEQGRLALVIQAMLLWASVIALALAYLLIQFRGLSSLTGIDQAQEARELARGNGFSTKNIRPLALQQLQRSIGKIPAGNFPDTFNPPLNPLINSLALRCFPGELTKKITGGSYVFAGDRLVAGVSVLFFIAALAVNYFLALRLFDRRIALLSATFVLLADQFWQFSLSGLPQMLLLFLFSCAAWVLAIAIRARREGRGTIGSLAMLGFFLGLMALTHPLTLWISAAVGAFCAFYFRGWIPRFLVPIIICLAMFSVWVVCDLKVTRTPFGISPFACLDGLSLIENGWMRELEPDYSRVSLSAFSKRVQGDFSYQLGSLYTLLGEVVVAPLFFISLLHRFKRDETEIFKWALLLMWLFTFCRLGSHGNQSPEHQCKPDLYPVWTSDDVLRSCIGLRLLEKAADSGYDPSQSFDDAAPGGHWITHTVRLSAGQFADSVPPRICLNSCNYLRPGQSRTKLLPRICRGPLPGIQIANLYGYRPSWKP